MTWQVWAALGGALVWASLTDWLFAGVLFHDRYLRHPEVWRRPGNNSRGIIVAQLLTIPTVLGMTLLLERPTDVPGINTTGSAIAIATITWAVAAAPATIVNGIFIKLDPAVVAAHTVGWLVKLVGVAVIMVQVVY